MDQHIYEKNSQTHSKFKVFFVVFPMCLCLQLSSAFGNAPVRTGVSVQIIGAWSLGPKVWIHTWTLKDQSHDHLSNCWAWDLRRLGSQVEKTRSLLSWRVQWMALTMALYIYMYIYICIYICIYIYRACSYSQPVHVPHMPAWELFTIGQVLHGKLGVWHGSTQEEHHGRTLSHALCILHVNRPAKFEIYFMMFMDYVPHYTMAYIYIQYPVLLYIGNIVYMNHFRIQGFLYIRDIPGKLHWDHWLCSGGCVWYGWACWRWPKQEVCCAVSSFTGASQQIRHLP
jgi:hypothetical protein